MTRATLLIFLAVIFASITVPTLLAAYQSPTMQIYLANWTLC